MKVKNSLLENKKLHEADEEEISAKTRDELTGVVDVGNASTAEVAKDVQDSIEKVSGTEVDKDQAEQTAEQIIAAADALAAKSAEYAAVNAKDKDSVLYYLDKCLSAGLRRWKLVQTDPNSSAAKATKGTNLLIWGAPGYGKTAGIKEWCEAMGIYLMQIPISTLTKDAISGIPWPVEDENNKGRYVQRNVESEMWAPLRKFSKVVIFLDEINTSKPDVEQALLTFIADRQLPIVEVKKDANGNTTEVSLNKQFNNILFFVAAMNPQGPLFPGTHELSNAIQQRLNLKKKQEGSKKEYLRVIQSLYKALLSNPRLSAADKYTFEGQLRIGEALMNDKNFKWDTLEDLYTMRSNIRNKNTELMPDAVNYRNISQVLFTCDGTKDDFLRTAQMEGFTDSANQMLKVALAAYTDKPKTGNNIWNKQASNVSQQVQAQTRIEIENILADVANSFED